MIFLSGDISVKYVVCTTTARKVSFTARDVVFAVSGEEETFFIAMFVDCVSQCR